MAEVEGSMCEAMWGNDNCGISFRQIEGISRGLLILWNTKTFKKQVKI